MREVGRGVAERLGFALVDEEIVFRAAAELGVEPKVVADAEKRRSFMERALNALTTPDSSGLGGFAAQEIVLDDELRDLLRAAIEETAQRGSAVIVAHAASHALTSRPDVLRVLVTGSPSIRRARVASERDLNEKDAARAVDQSDAARAHYLKRFYGAKSELPTHYDLVVNTDRLSPDQAVSLVTRTAAT
jgi:cytidylate kinase